MSKATIDQLKAAVFPVLTTILSGLAFFLWNDMNNKIDVMQGKIDRLMKYEVLLEKLDNATTLPFKPLSYTIEPHDIKGPEEEIELKKLLNNQQ